MPRVFLIHEPSRWDSALQRMVKFNLSRLDDHGRRFIVFPGADRPPKPQDALAPMREAFAGYREDDFIAMVGDPDLWVIGTVLALQTLNGQPVGLLRWNNRAREYERSYTPQGLWSTE